MTRDGYSDLKVFARRWRIFGSEADGAVELAFHRGRATGRLEASLPEGYDPAEVPEPQRLLAASSQDYWDNITAEVRAAGEGIRHALLLNHQAAHLLAWANLARNQAIANTSDVQGVVKGDER